jgi:hypothetical protein
MANDRRLHPVLTVAVATVLGVDLANVRAYTGVPSFAVSTAGGLLLGVLAVLWLRLPRGASMPASWIRWLGTVPALLGGASILLRGAIGAGPLLVLGLAAAFGVVGTLAATLARRPLGVVAGAIVCGLALRAWELAVIPINPGRADMVPLVMLAADRTLSGLSPYVVYHLPWAVPLTYLPGTWLPYAPLFVAGIDPRWTNPAAELLVLGAIVFAGRHRRDKTLRDAALVLWAAWFVSNPMFNYDASTTAQPQWAALAWVAALAAERSRWTPAAIGLAVATTLLVGPLLPVLFIAWHRGPNRPRARRPHRGSATPLLLAIASATVVAAILVAPWALTAPRGFFDGVVLWFNDLSRFPREKWLESRTWATYPGMAGVFWTLHLERWMKPIQIALVIGLAAAFARRTAAVGPRELLAPQLVGVLLAFLLFNPVIWGYLWEAAVAVSLVALAAARQAPNGTR